MHFSEDSELSCLVCWAHIFQHMWTCACVLFGHFPLIINAFHYSNEAILLSLKRPCPRCQTRPIVANSVGSSSWITARVVRQVSTAETHRVTHGGSAPLRAHLWACMFWLPSRCNEVNAKLPDCKVRVKLDLTWCNCLSLYKVNLWSTTWSFFFLNGKKKLNRKPA